jgi:hypothetical protein
LKYFMSVLNKTGSIYEDVCNKVREEQAVTRILISILWYLNLNTKKCIEFEVLPAQQVNAIYRFLTTVY